MEGMSERTFWHDCTGPIPVRTVKAALFKCGSYVLHFELTDVRMFSDGH